MKKHYTLWIGGQSVPGADTFDVVNPADLSVIAQAPAASPAQLDEAVAAARAAFPAWSALPWTERQARLQSLADAVEAHGDELARLLCLEQGKPLKGFADMGAGFELGGALAWIRATAALTLPPETIQDDEHLSIEVHRKPIGVVGSITPWNYPLLIAIWHITPALLAGNTVVLKPSEQTPLTTLRLAELANGILPPGVLNVVAGAGELGARISQHDGIDKIVFTGSTPTGQAIMRSAAGNLKRLTLELGGNDAGIVLDDVDVQAVAGRIFATAFINNGQTCAALKRLYVQDGVYEAMCEALTAIAATVRTGNGLSPDSDFGPLQNEKQLKIVESLVDDARQRGARVLCGGRRTDTRGHFYPVTLVADISDGAPLVDREQFGPVLPIIRFSDPEDALARANASENGLGGSVWSSDTARAEALAARLACGTAWINHHAVVQPNAPFGGVKASGFGVEFGLPGLAEFTTLQTRYKYKPAPGTPA